MCKHENTNQKKETFNIFSRKNNEFIREINLNTNQTDGCEIVTIPLIKIFNNGLFVAMNNGRNFYFFGLDKLGLDQDSWDTGFQIKKAFQNQYFCLLA